MKVLQLLWAIRVFRLFADGHVGLAVAVVLLCWNLVGLVVLGDAVEQQRKNRCAWTMSTNCSTIIRHGLPCYVRFLQVSLVQIGLAAAVPSLPWTNLQAAPDDAS